MSKKTIEQIVITRLENSELTGPWDADQRDTEVFMKMFKAGMRYKSMLISSDIQIGDKVRYNMAPESEHVADEECLIMDCFKVIGEISPEATYVKEGAEFDKDEIDSTWYSSTDCSQRICKIKGPCGHFH